MGWADLVGRRSDAARDGVVPCQNEKPRLLSGARCVAACFLIEGARLNASAFSWARDVCVNNLCYTAFSCGRICTSGSIMFA